MTRAESPEARREREACPVCRSPQRRTVERMRRVDQAAYAEIYRYLQSVNDDASLRWVIRHFGRGHDLLSPSDDTQLPAWLFADENELVRYMQQYGYCRTIDDLCPHIPAGTVSSCEQIDHPECGRWRSYTLRERLVDVEARNVAPATPPPATGAPLSLVEPLVVHQAIEVESKSGPRRGIYASTVLVLEPHLVVIAVPTRLHELLPLAPGDRVSVSYQGRVSKYVFETAVRGVKENRVELEPPASVEIASRRSPRIPLRDSAVKVVRVERGGEELAGTAINASVQGIRVLLPSELVQWERVRVVVSLADGPLTAEGEVVRVEPQSSGEVAHGIYFTGLTADDLQRLQRLGG